MVTYYRIGEGPPVLLQHGFLGSWSYWAPVTAYLARRFDVIVPDLPGFGSSVDEPMATSIPEFAGRLITFLDMQGVGRVSLVGHSLGSLVCLQAALDHPDRFDSLVLYGCAPSPPRFRFESLETTIAKIEAGGVANVAPRIVETWFMRGGLDPYYSPCLSASSGVKASTAIATLRAISEWDVRDRLHELRVRTLILCGDRDRSTPPENAYELWRGIPNSNLCVVPCCAHNVHLERPGVFNEIVADFI